MPRFPAAAGATAVEVRQEMDANEIIFKGTGAGCAQCDRLIVTEA